MKDFDAIVIGSGIGGLISAGILASKGLRTLLIERHVTPGGYIASFERKGFVFDAAVDCISGVAPDGLIFKVLEKLGVHNDLGFLRIDPIRVSIFPDIEIPVDADMNAYIDRLTSLFPSESAGIKEFFKIACRVYEMIQSATNMFISNNAGSNNISPKILKFMNTTYNELLSEYLKDYRLKAILSDRCPFLGLPPSRVSLISMIALIMSYFTHGAYRPVGGFQRLADVLADGIRKNGGRVILGNGVKKILLDRDNNCCGIICDNADEYTSRHIISNADFNSTFKNLLGGRHASIAEKMTTDVGVSMSFFIVYTGIKGEIKTHSSLGYFPSYDIESFFKPEAAFMDKSTIGITISSLEDKFRAPHNCHTVVFHEMVEATNKDFDKSRCTDIILKKTEKVIPDLKDRILVIDSATPQTLERYTGNYRGAAFGWRQASGFRNVARHGIKNLSIAGHWGDMGGGVLAAAYSGAKAAGEILMKEGLQIDI
ncbi:MAG: NAD(P)/FAD-dependent oxidoreductase [Nitrospirae bacterium]|nr:NAD(P)/FAD-dependent oxidoreductase [Nitrospirota bacterium]